jgi:hypothetical protein
VILRVFPLRAASLAMTASTPGMGVRGGDVLWAAALADRFAADGGEGG